MLESFVRKVVQVARRFEWIRRIEIVSKGMRHVKLRLWLNSDFVEIYFNEKNGSFSYAYIEQGNRLFGANNMYIGWHWHPFGKTERHERVSKEISIEEFLKKLEDELRKRGKI